MKDEWKGHETDFPTPVGKIIDLAYCLSLLFGRPVVSVSLTYRTVRTSYTALYMYRTYDLRSLTTSFAFCHLIRALKSQSGHSRCIKKYRSEHQTLFPRFGRVWERDPAQLRISSILCVQVLHSRKLYHPAMFTGRKWKHTRISTCYAWSKRRCQSES